MQNKGLIKVFFLFILLGGQALWALSLNKALMQANQNFSIEEQQLVIKQTKLSLKKNQQAYDVQLSLKGQLGLRDSLTQEDDHQLYFYLNKVLFNSDQQTNIDFNQTNINLENAQLKHLKILHRFNIMQVFFDGVLADLEYDYLTQVLALSAVEYNHAKDDFEFGYISEVELLGRQTQTQLDLAKRQSVENKQINHRSKLASLLKIPDLERPDELKYPILKKYLDYEANNEQWHKLVNQHHLLLKLLKQEIKALKTKQQHYQDDRQWMLSGYTRLGGQTYNKEKEGNYRVGISLDIPLNNIERENELTSMNLAMMQKEIALAKQQDQLNQEVLSLFLTFKYLKQQETALTQQKDYLQFNLDKASLEYEMHLSRNIGNAMVLVTKNDFYLASTIFALVLTIEKLNLLTQGHAL